MTDPPRTNGPQSSPTPAARTDPSRARGDERLDAGRCGRAHIGVIALATDLTIEQDMARMCPEGVGVFTTRIETPQEITAANLSAMRSLLAGAARQLLPGDRLDVVCFGCTSGSLVIGEDRVMAELSRAAPRSQATTVATAVVAALRELEVGRLAVGTPYIDEVNRRQAQWLARHGFEVLCLEGLGLLLDRDIGRAKPEVIEQLGRSVDRPDAEAVFLSCTALRSLEVIEQLERALAKPVITSNQATMWHCLRLAGIDDRLTGLGRLLEQH